MSLVGGEDWVAAAGKRRLERGPVWTTSAPDRQALKRAGYVVWDFARFRRSYIEPVEAVAQQRTSLDNAAAAALAQIVAHPAIALVNVPLGNFSDLRALYGFVVEPAYRNDRALLIAASRDLDELDPQQFSEPEFGYAWTLERLRHLAARYRRRSIDSNLPPLTPIEALLLDALREVGLQPHAQYGIGPYRVDFALPERGLAVEADGRGWHDAEHDRGRDARLALRGWSTLHFSGSEICRDAGGCAASVLAAYRQRPELPIYTDVSPVDVRRGLLERVLAWLKSLVGAPESDEAEAAWSAPETAPSPPSQWCEGLDAEQQAAVGAHESVVQVIAPAGSGKTRVLVARVRELVARGVPEERILCTTFNKATERELRERLHQEGVAGVAIRTFHAIGYYILKEEGVLRESVGALSYGQWRWLCKQAKDAEEDRVWIDVPEAQEAVSDYKLGQMIGPQAAASLALGAHQKTAAHIYSLYEEQLNQLKRHDYDDLICEAVALLRSDAAVRRRWQERWECLLVDEYQDIEPAMERLIQLLAAPEDCLLVVGDEDQCIYTWRRAEVERIIDLDKRYPGLQRVVLPTCYRCPADVTDAASRLIAHNKRRFPKQIRAGRAPCEASSIVIKSVKHLPEAAPEIAATLASLDLQETVVVARTSRLLRGVALACMSAGIPVRAGKRVLQPAQSERVVLAYLRLLAVPTQARGEDVDAVFRVPNRYLPNGSEHVLAGRLRAGLSFAEATVGLEAEQWRVARLAEGAELFDRLKAKGDAGALIHALRTEGGLDKHYSDRERIAHHDQVEIEALEALEAEGRGRPARGLAESVASRAKALAAMSGDDGVELTTVHGAKGREWSHVIVYGCDDDQLPHKRTLADAEAGRLEAVIEDERRLAYVALTRTKGRLDLIHTVVRRAGFFSRLA